MRRRWAGRLAVSIGAIGILIASVVLLSYARWLQGISKGNQALAVADVATAQRAYESAARQIGFLPSPGKVLPAGYRELVFNRARTLYAQQGDDVLARFLETEAARSPQLSEDSEYHYWIGNTQFRKAISQKDKQQRQSGLQQAAESYRRALMTSPDDWDAKYNYELSTRLLEGLRKGKQDNLEKMKRGQMKLLREDNETKKEQQRQVAPEKRG